VWFCRHGQDIKYEAPEDEHHSVGAKPDLDTNASRELLSQGNWIFFWENLSGQLLTFVKIFPLFWIVNHCSCIEKVACRLFLEFILALTSAVATVVLR
jgi:hypothetical protein